ncbi:integral membrane protein [Ascosphaera apis ARSEF 7405]|uniref:Integral membrane protein n=1 Tax=Ascosphaera apis ARSEF 7405 TaxID=392613 RepID=A0A168A742_9EURO|nr:integral membrane protein [Ascosphaera apis ARSEF 7405]
MATKFDSDLHDARAAIHDAAHDLWDATSNTVIKEKAHDVAHRVGERLTGGPESRGYMTIYLQELQHNPLRTKMFTSGVLSALQELVASVCAGDKSKHGNYVNARMPKMAMYGALISAPLGHVLIGILQRLFKGKTTVKAKIWQILVSNLIISPIQNVVYIFFMAVIAGARELHQIRTALRVGFLPIMKVSWLTSPISLAFAQRFIPEHAWVPFFNIVGFIIGTYVNYKQKRMRMDAISKKLQDGKAKEKRRRNLNMPPPGPGQSDIPRDVNDYPSDRAERGASHWDREAREARESRGGRDDRASRDKKRNQ